MGMLTGWTELRTEWKEHDGKVWNMMEGPEWCWNDVRASEMDLAKFYMIVVMNVFCLIVHLFCKAQIC